MAGNSFPKPTRWDELRLELARLLNIQSGGFPTTAIYQDKPLGIDVSHWTGQLDWKWLAENAGIKFGVAKVGELSYSNQPIADTRDELWPVHVQGMHDAGIPCGGYWFHNPQWYAESMTLDALGNLSYDRDKQVLCLREHLANKTYHFLAIDYERYWDSYPINKGKKIPAVWINHTGRVFAGNVLRAMDAGWIKRVPLYIYTARWFVEGYTRTSDGASAYDWLRNYPVWEALYYAKSGNCPDWETLRSGWMPPDTLKPSQLNSTCRIWQWSGDRIALPTGASGIKTLDLDMLYDRTLDAWYQEIGWQTAPPPPPTTDIERRLAELEAREAMDRDDIDLLLELVQDIREVFGQNSL